MKRGIILVLIISLLSMSLGSVEAANSQGFEWGVDVGDRIDYRITYSQPSITTDPTGAYDFYVTVISLPTIPEPVTSFFAITIGPSSVEFYYTNDTQIFMIPWAAVAIGNWSLATDLYEAQITTGNVSETATDWIIKQVLPFGEDQSVFSEVRISKTDGVVNYSDLTTKTTAGEIISSITIIRSGYNPGFLGGINPILLLALGAGGAIIVIVAVIIVRRKQ